MTITINKKPPRVKTTQPVSVGWITMRPNDPRDSRVMAEITKLVKATGQSRHEVLLTILDAALKDVKVNGYSHE